jgi:hypothetical protein
MSVGTFQALIITSSLLYELNNSCPVTQSHSQIQCQILSVNILVDLFSLIISLEISRDFSLLLELFIKMLEFINKQDAIVVFIFDERPLSDLKVKFIE